MNLIILLSVATVLLFFITLPYVIECLCCPEILVTLGRLCVYRNYLPSCFLLYCSIYEASYRKNSVINLHFIAHNMYVYKIFNDFLLFWWQTENFLIWLTKISAARFCYILASLSLIQPIQLQSNQVEIIHI